MKQNKYHDPNFFTKTARCGVPLAVWRAQESGPRSVACSRSFAVSGKRVLDLGCGFGWHCRYAREQGASFVVGVDVSQKMLARAKADTKDPVIEYRLGISSLALHYVEALDLVCRNISRWLRERCTFVFSVEHPMFTAIAAQEWCLGPGGERLHWPVDDYHEEGWRHTQWMADNVIKYHRTIASYVNTLIEAGLSSGSSNLCRRRRCLPCGRNGKTSAGGPCFC